MARRPKITLALDDETEELLTKFMAEAGIKSRSRVVRYCISAALGVPLQKAAILETELWFRQLSLLVFRKFAGRFASELPEIVEEVLANSDNPLASEDEDDVED